MTTIKKVKKTFEICANQIMPDSLTIPNLMFSVMEVIIIHLLW